MPQSRKRKQGHPARVARPMSPAPRYTGDSTPEGLLRGLVASGLDAVVEKLRLARGIARDWPENDEAARSVEALEIAALALAVCSDEQSGVTAIVGKNAVESAHTKLKIIT